MAEERERRKANEVTQDVADEGNVPGQPSMPGILIAVIVLIGLVLTYVAWSYKPSHPPSSPPQSSRQ
jgi:hypothetical protein